MRRLKTTLRGDAAIREWIDGYFLRRRAREESISYLVQCIREDGIRFPTRHSDAMDAFEKLGYRLRSETNEHGALLRTYVEAI
jgi:hypothetical protein